MNQKSYFIREYANGKEVYYMLLKEIKIILYLKVLNAFYKKVIFLKAEF